MMKSKTITKEIMDLFYEKDGWLYWKNDGKKIKKDTLAGKISDSGYYKVFVHRKSYRNHRILYQFYHNVILDPEQQIDHIDMNKQNNSKENLRLCTNSENSMNKITRRDNKIGFKNIRIIKTNNYEYYYIKIVKNHKVVFSKYYRTDKFAIQEVIKIRDTKLLEIHGEFANINTLVILK